MAEAPPPSSSSSGSPHDTGPVAPARRCSHSNLQALREIDARGSVSFLRCSSQAGDCRLLVDSPDYGLLSAEDDSERTTWHVPASSRDSCQVTSGGAPPARGVPPVLPDGLLRAVGGMRARACRRRVRPSFAGL